jgi:hypothetical protein
LTLEPDSENLSVFSVTSSHAGGDITCENICGILSTDGGISNASIKDGVSFIESQM